MSGKIYTYAQYLEDVGGDGGDPSAARSAYIMHCWLNSLPYESGDGTIRVAKALDEFDREVATIRASIEAHQMREFGRLLTEDEVQASEIERHEEDRRRFAGMSSVEVAKILQADATAFCAENAALLKDWPTLPD
jgi:hypothetical protein